MASLVTIHNYQAAAGLCNKGPIEGWMEPQYLRPFVLRTARGRPLASRGRYEACSAFKRDLAYCAPRCSCSCSCVLISMYHYLVGY